MQTSSTTPPEELHKPRKVALADTYYCNFSLFQSLAGLTGPIEAAVPDRCPIHRLDERATRGDARVLADLTCDSDGKVDKLHRPARRQERPLEASHLRSTAGCVPYYLAFMFLVGAYQEILGDLHNLFGDTNTVIVSADEAGYSIDHVVPGNTVQEVLAYVGYERSHLMARVRRSAERSLRDGRITRTEARELIDAYRRGLDSYTYLER